jgi:Cd2+/Zn2+-exporting ATPase
VFDLLFFLLLPFAILWTLFDHLTRRGKIAIHFFREKIVQPYVLQMPEDPCAGCRNAGRCSPQRKAICPKRRLALQSRARPAAALFSRLSTVQCPQAVRPLYRRWQRWIESHPQLINREWLEPRLVAVTGLAMAGSFIGARMAMPGFAVAALDLISFAAGAFFGTLDGLAALRHRRIEIDLLMVLFALGTAVIGYWNEAALLLFLFSFSNVLQDFAVSRNRSAIAGLITLHPNRATVLRDGQPQTVEVRDIRAGELVRVRPGERLPVDGVVRDGGSFVDQSAITGESLPVWKQPGAAVYAGTLNQRGTLDIEATAAPDDTLLARIIKRVEDAPSSRSETESFVERFEQRYSVLLLAGGVVITLLHLLAEPNHVVHALQASMVLLTVASPCALVMSAPTAFISAIAWAARQGILFKGSIYLERLAKMSAVVFDKTGTLTAGNPVVTDVIPAPGWTASEALRLAAALENRSEHPLARAILAAARPVNGPLPPVSDFEAIPGQGVRGRLDGRWVEVCRPGSAFEKNFSPFAQAVADLEDQGKTVVTLVVDSAVVALIALADTLRPEARRVVADLRAGGMQVVMLTGDNMRAARYVARELGIDTVYAELLPDDKISLLQRIQAETGPAIMVGDGINDAPALARAGVSIAMGQTGTDVTLETADVVLMSDRLELIGEAIRLSHKTRRVIWQNIVFALAGMAALVVFALLTEDLPLPLAVLGHEGGTVLVVINSLMTLLLWPEIKRRQPKQWFVRTAQETFCQSFRAIFPHTPCF